MASHQTSTHEASGWPGAGIWLMSLRPFSFTASVMPMLLALVLVQGSDITWWVFIPYFVAGLLLHAGTNVLNDYYDYVNGVDTEDDIDPSHLLPRKMVTPRFMKISGHMYFLTGVIVGSLIGFERGGVFVALGITGAVLAYFYTGARISLKYVALGDVLVFFLLGPAMVAMGTWALRGDVLPGDILISLPMAFFVASILHANNLRDIQTDREAGVRTLAGVFGPVFARHFMTFLLMAPFVLLGGLIVADVLPLFTLFSLLTLVPAARLLQSVYEADAPSSLVDLTMRAAMVHMLFSVLFIAGLFVHGLTGAG